MSTLKFHSFPEDLYLYIQFIYLFIYYLLMNVSYYILDSISHELRYFDGVQLNIKFFFVISRNDVIVFIS